MKTLCLVLVVSVATFGGNVLKTQPSFFFHLNSCLLSLLTDYSRTTLSRRGCVLSVLMKFIWSRIGEIHPSEKLFDTSHSFMHVCLAAQHWLGWLQPFSLAKRLKSSCRPWDSDRAIFSSNVVQIFVTMSRTYIVFSAMVCLAGPSLISIGSWKVIAKLSFIVAVLPSVFVSVFIFTINHLLL